MAKARSRAAAPDNTLAALTAAKLAYDREMKRLLTARDRCIAASGKLLRARASVDDAMFGEIDRAVTQIKRAAAIGAALVPRDL